MGALLGRNEDRLAMRDGQRGYRPTSPAREGGRRGRAWQRGRGRREADRILERARTEADKMVSEHEVYLAAVAEAEALRKETLSDTARMRQETDDFIDAKLASFEITLQKTLQTVDRGRERIRSQMYEDLAPVGGDEFFDGAAEPEHEDYYR